MHPNIAFATMGIRAITIVTFRRSILAFALGILSPHIVQWNQVGRGLGLNNMNHHIMFIFHRNQRMQYLWV